MRQIGTGKAFDLSLFAENPGAIARHSRHLSILSGRGRCIKNQP